jgi:hypothetical protein
MLISAPFNVKHNIHVQVDPLAPTGFKGLPPQWDAMLSVSGISKAEVSAHPQEVLDVLQFHMEGPPPKLPKKAALGEEQEGPTEGGVAAASAVLIAHSREPSWRSSGSRARVRSRPCRRPHVVLPCLVASRAERELDQASLFSKGDPSALFEGMRKLGEGASGTVFLGTDRRTGAKVAIKQAAVSDLANLKTEIAIQKLSAHPCIVSYLETYLHREQLWVRRAPAGPRRSRRPPSAAVSGRRREVHRAADAVAY